MSHDNEIPYDPHSDIFSHAAESDRLFSGIQLDTIEDALRLDIKESTPSLNGIVGGEGVALTRLVASYGLEAAMVDDLGKILTSTDTFVFKSAPSGNPGIISGADAIFEDPETNITNVYIAPNMIRNFILDAIHTLEPVGGDDEISFARDTGVKMACTYALTLLCFELQRQRAGTVASPKAEELFQVGHEEVPHLSNDQYSEFLPHRLAARLAIDRLAQIVTTEYDVTEAHERVELYGFHRQRAFANLRTASLGGLSMIDIATVRPLSIPATQEFFGLLPHVSRNPQGIEIVE